jgi:hypothetical protein
VLSIIIVFFSYTLVALYSYLLELGRGILKLLTALRLAGASRASCIFCNVLPFLRGILKGVACPEGSKEGCKVMTLLSGVFLERGGRSRVAGRRYF